VIEIVTGYALARKVVERAISFEKHEISSLSLASSICQPLPIIAHFFILPCKPCWYYEYCNLIVFLFYARSGSTGLSFMARIKWK